MPPAAEDVLGLLDDRVVPGLLDDHASHRVIHGPEAMREARTDELTAAVGWLMRRDCGARPNSGAPLR